LGKTKNSNNKKAFDLKNKIKNIIQKNSLDIFVYIILICVAILTINFFKPIFIDEFLNYAFISETSFTRFINILLKSIENVNHGQTGLYTILNYISFQILPPSQIILRLPSYFALIITIIITGRILLQFDSKKLSPFIFIAIYINSGYVNDYFNLSRTYSFLILAYIIFVRIFQMYFIESISKKELKYLLILLFIVNMFHPYIILYNFIFTGAIILITIKKRSQTLRLPIILYSLAVNTSLSVLIGMITWMNRSEIFDMDPYFYLPKNIHPIIAIYFSQFYFIIIPVTTLLTLISLAVFFFGENTIKEIIQNNSVIIKFVISILIISAIIIFLTAGISMFSGYWIMPKQWVSVSFGTIAMYSLGLSFFINKHVFKFRAILIILIFINVGIDLVQIYDNRDKLLLELTPTECQKIERLATIKSVTNQQWEEIGTCDLIVLKKTWPGVRYFYD
jgi:hypothetical protein